MSGINNSKNAYEELINILYNNKEIRKFFICEDIDDNNKDKELLRTIQVKLI